MSVLCTNCYQPVDSALLAAGESYSWCPKCKCSFRVPLLYVPEWMLGLLAILVMNLYFNF
jgi:hypothetical protein